MVTENEHLGGPISEVSHSTRSWAALIHIVHNPTRKLAEIHFNITKPSPRSYGLFLPYKTLWSNFVMVYKYND
jgi:hypothetical protein